MLFFFFFFDGEKERECVCYTSLKNDISTTFLQQILSDRLLLVIIVGAKK